MLFPQDAKNFTIDTRYGNFSRPCEIPVKFYRPPVILSPLHQRYFQSSIFFIIKKREGGGREGINEQFLFFQCRSLYLHSRRNSIENFIGFKLIQNQL